MNSAQTKWSNQTRLIVTLVLLVIGAYLLFRFSSIIKPLILAIVLAFVLSPLVNRLQTVLKFPRVVIILLVYLALALIVGLALWLILPAIFTQFKEIFHRVEHILRQSESWLGTPLIVAGIVIDPRSLLEETAKSFQTWGQPLFGRTLVVLTDIATSLAWTVFIVVISIYLIKDSRSLMAWFQSLCPPDFLDDYQYLLGEINRIWSAFFRGQLLLAFTVMIIISVVGLVIGLPFALLMGLLAGLLEFLPSLGHTIWLVIAVILALVVGSNWIPVPNWVFAFIVIGAAVIFQQVDLNYLIPRIIGKSVHLPPLVVILGIITGAALAGVLGIVLAAPTIASTRVLGRYVYGHLVGYEPPAEPIDTPLPLPRPFWLKRGKQNLENPTLE